MTKQSVHELDVPGSVLDAESSVEVFRAFVADGALHVTFDPQTFSHDASEWGRLLADSAQHIADAIALDGQLSRDDALAAIKAGLSNAFTSEAETRSEARSGRIQRGRRH